MSIQKLDILLEGTRVVLVFGDKRILEVQFDVAHEIADAIRYQANRAEEIARHERSIMDHAILLRSGAPFGTAVDPRVRREAAKEAAYNRELRRYLPGGVKSRESLGTPSVVNHSPRRRDRG